MNESYLEVFNDKEKSEDLFQYANQIKQMLLDHDSYFIRYPTYVDDINVDITIYKHNYFEIACKNVYYSYEDTEGFIGGLVIFRSKYKSIIHAILMIYQIIQKYKIYSGTLLSPKSYERLQFEEKYFNKKKENENVCCVCFTSTTEKTKCGHYICLKCRCKTITKCETQSRVRFANAPCPICRNLCLDKYYDELNFYYNDYEEDEIKNHGSCTLKNCSTCGGFIKRDEYYNEYSVDVEKSFINAKKKRDVFNVIEHKINDMLIHNENNENIQIECKISISNEENKNNEEYNEDDIDNENEINNMNEFHRQDIQENAIMYFNSINDFCNNNPLPLLQFDHIQNRFIEDSNEEYNREEKMDENDDNEEKEEEDSMG